jgi:hypothetical protein
MPPVSRKRYCARVKLCARVVGMAHPSGIKGQQDPKCVVLRRHVAKGVRGHVSLQAAHWQALEHEVLRRKSERSDFTTDGQRINFTRNIIVMELIEARIDLPPGWKDWE